MQRVVITKGAEARTRETLHKWVIGGMIVDHFTGTGNLDFEMRPIVKFTRES